MNDEALAHSQVDLELDPVAIETVLADFRDRITRLEESSIKKQTLDVPPLLRCRITGDGPFIKVSRGDEPDINGRYHYYREGATYSDDPQCNQGSIRKWAETLEPYPPEARRSVDFNRGFSAGRKSLRSHVFWWALGSALTSGALSHLWTYCVYGS